MKFYVNETEFNGVLDFSNVIDIKSLNKNYKVTYNNKNLDTLVNEIYEKNDFILIDRNVYNLSPSTFNDILNNILIFDAIEDNKNIENVLLLIDLLLEKKFTKNNKILVIGGGITQEIGGFAAAIYKRGLNWILIPTTILSMTDSCIGSKVSINHKSKNMLGLFIAPNEIYISDYFLNSLNNDDIISGLGEALKLSLIGGNETYSYFKEKLIKKDYINIIKMASLVKKEIIEFDEFENNERKVLNYGHTVGHALESTSKYFIPHGIAIMIGMYIKNELFYEGKYKEINEIILNLVDKKFYEIELNYNEFINHVLNDKKNKGDNIFFILLNDIGKSIFIYKTKEDIEEKIKIILKKLFKNYTD
jgi:3-dehydroquinate synthase